jgi:two-component system LytT family sensor kinase
MKRIIQISKNRFVQHVVFWALYLGPCIHSLVSTYGVKGLVPSSGIILITLSVCYFNLYFLIPRLLLKEKISAYFVAVSLLTLLYALLWTALFIVCLRFVFHSTRPVDFAGMYLSNLFDQTMTIAITTALKLSKDWFRQQQRNKELAVQNMYSEIRLLKSQINPHFLFNTLNSLYAFTLKKSDKAPETVLKLSYIMEYMIYESNEAEVQLQKELKYLQDYIDLERLRQTENTEVVFEICGQVNGQKIAPLLLLPFVENAFKHGVNKMAGNAKVHISINLDGHFLHFKSYNNKSLIRDDANPSKNEGFGIKNVIGRLDLIYPDKYTLDITNDPDFYKVNLNLQVS